MNVNLLLTIAQNLPPEKLKEHGWERVAQQLYGGAFEQTRDAFPVTGFFVGVIGLCILMLAIWGWRRSRQSHLRSAPMAVFHRMANHLNLDLQQQWLLVRIARQQALPTPLTLMLSDATLAHHAGEYARQAPPRKQRDLSARVAAISRTLFGSSG